MNFGIKFPYGNYGNLEEDFQSKINIENSCNKKSQICKKRTIQKIKVSNFIVMQIQQMKGYPSTCSRTKSN